MTHPTQAAGAATLTDEQIEDCIDAANRKFNGRSMGPRGQQMTAFDDWKHWLAREIESAVLASAAPAPSAPTDAKSVAGSEHDPAVCDAAYQSALHEIAALKLKLAEAETKLDAYVDWCENMNTGPMFFEPQGDQS